MKKKFSAILLSVFVLSIVAVYAIGYRSHLSLSHLPTATPQPSFHLLQADRLRRAYNTDELREASDLIVVAKVMPGKENKLITSSDGEYVVSGHTLTNLQVISTIKGDLDSDTITITEEYFSVPVEGGTLDHWTQQAYLPANENETYLFFLKKYDINLDVFPNMYFPVDLQYGKYVLNSPVNLMSDSAFESLEVLDNVYGHDYPTWYSEIYDTYISEYLGEQTDAVPDTDPSAVPDTDPSANPDTVPSTVPDADTEAPVSSM